MKLPFSKNELPTVAVLFLAAFLVRFAFFWHQGFAATDTADFSAWFRVAADVGPQTFYTTVSWCDYPPFNVYFFWIFGSVAKALDVFGSSLFTYVMKLPSNLFDMATSFLIFAFVRKRFSLRWAVVAMALYAFNPAVIFDSAVWGQFDAIYTFLLVLSIFLYFENRPRFAVAAFVLGVLTKPQSIALAPLFFFLIWRKTNWKGFADSILVALATVFAVILPMDWPNGNAFSFLSGLYFGAYGGYPFTTLNAFNVWGFGGMWVQDTQLTFTLGWVMFASVATFALYFVHKRIVIDKESTVLLAAFLLLFAFFMLPTRIHERYLFPAMAALALLFPFAKKTRLLYVALTATCFVNQVYVLDFLNRGAFLSAGDPVVFTVSLINSLALLYVLMLMTTDLKGKGWLTTTNAQSGNIKAVEPRNAGN